MHSHADETILQSIRSLLEGSWWALPMVGLGWVVLLAILFIGWITQAALLETIVEGGQDRQPGAGRSLTDLSSEHRPAKEM